MSNRLFETDGVAVTRTDEDNSQWTIGFDLQATLAAMSLDVQDPCDASSLTHLSGVSSPVSGSGTNPNVYTPKSFAALVSAFRNIRCADGEELQIAIGLLADGAAEGAAEYVLWNGLSSWDPAVQPSLANSDVSHVSAAGTTQDSISAAIARYTQLTALQRYIVHLGVEAAFDLSATGMVYSDGSDVNTQQIRLRATDTPVVISPYYPANGIAVTGPIEVLIAPPNAWQVYDIAKNRTEVSGYQLLLIDFDPGSSVLVV